MKNKGLFITFEGGEGSGKTTQIEMLAKMFIGQGKDVLLTREPGGSPGAEEIRKLLVTGDPERWNRMEEIFLFLVARSNHLSQVILPAIQQGKVVICDRFHDSTIAYQGFGYGNNQAIQDQISQLYTMIAGNFKPDLTILLDIPVDVGLKRSKRPENKEQRFESKKLAFHENLRQGYLTLAKAEPNRFLVVNANQPKEAVFQGIVNGMAERQFFLKVQKAGVEEESLWIPPSYSR
ncbi:MAG: dTMP kinase [Alphaproteobacteria bacterium]|nr:dTMP kinase [Alphaproteobacteria bacterium]